MDRGDNEIGFEDEDGAVACCPAVPEACVGTLLLSCFFCRTNSERSSFASASSSSGLRSVGGCCAINEARLVGACCCGLMKAWLFASSDCCCEAMEEVELLDRPFI